MKEGMATFKIKGSCDSIDVNYTMVIGGNGIIHVDYQAEGIPENKSLQEFGLYFFTADFSQLSWSRDAYFTGYPEGHLGSTEGEVDLTREPLTKYREKPGHAWALDAQNFYYHGLDTVLAYSNIVRAMKENILSFSLKNDQGSTISVLSDGTQAARFDRIKGENCLLIDDKWDYPALDWGNYMKMTKTEEVLSGKAIIRLNH
jgi:hypothetical protein